MGVNLLPLQYPYTPPILILLLILFTPLTLSFYLHFPCPSFPSPLLLSIYYSIFIPSSYTPYLPVSLNNPLFIAPSTTPPPHHTTPSSNKPLPPHLYLNLLHNDYYIQPPSIRDIFLETIFSRCYKLLLYSFPLLTLHLGHVFSFY